MRSNELEVIFQCCREIQLQQQLHVSTSRLTAGKVFDLLDVLLKILDHNSIPIELRILCGQNIWKLIWFGFLEQKFANNSCKEQQLSLELEPLTFWLLSKNGQCGSAIIDELVNWICNGFEITSLETRFNGNILSDAELAAICGFVQTMIQDDLSNNSLKKHDLCRLLLRLIDLSLTSANSGLSFDNYFAVVILSHLLKSLNSCLIDFSIVESEIENLSDLLQSMTDSVMCLIHLHWDSPFVGVVEWLENCFTSLTNCLHPSQRRSHFFAHYLRLYCDDSSLSLPYYVKGKWRLIARLLTTIDRTEIDRCLNSIYSQIIQAMNVNHLASSASAVFKVLIDRYRKEFIDFESNFECCWVSNWIIDGLGSHQNNVAMNVCRYWLPCVQSIDGFLRYLKMHFLEKCQQFLKQFNSKQYDFGLAILKSIDVDSLLNLELFADYQSSQQNSNGCFKESDSNCFERSLWSYSVVTRFLVQQQNNNVSIDLQKYCDPTAIEGRFLGLALRHRQNEIRIEAFYTLILLSKSTRVDFDDYLLKLNTFLENNLTVDDSPFRQKLCNYYRKFLEINCVNRTRKTSHKIALSSLENSQKLEKFFETLISKMFSNLFPGANYQRLSTSLLLIGLTLEILSDKNRKWFERIRLSCLSEKEALILIHCLQSSSSSEMKSMFCYSTPPAPGASKFDIKLPVRELASLILSNYFCWPLSLEADSLSLEVDSLSSLEICRQLCELALQLCNSPKELDCHAGAGLMMMVVEKYVDDVRWLIRFDKKLSIEIDDSQQSTIDKSMALELLMRCAFEQIEFCYHQFQIDLHAAANNHPLHGFIKLATSVFTVDRFKDFSATTVFKLQSLVEDVLEFVLQKFGSSDERSIPSFADLDEVVSDHIAKTDQSEPLISDCLSASYCGGDNRDIYSISANYQLVLAAFWLTMKDCSYCLAQFAKYYYFQLLSHQKQHNDDLLERLESIGDSLFSLLTRVRHWGVLEGCSVAFIEFCQLCLTSNIPRLRRIPRKLLDNILGLVESSSNVSITRRSVGFPLVIHCILQVESKLRENYCLLHRTFECLLRVAEKPIYGSIDQTVDLPQVRALNCLQMLFRSSQLGYQVLIYVSDAFKITLNSFLITHWSVRNSATMLYAALVWRMLGHRELVDASSGASVSSWTLPEFCGLFWQVWRYLCEILPQLKPTGDPRLRPILSLLYGIIMPAADIDIPDAIEKSLAKSVRISLFKILLSSADARVRSSVATVLVQLSPGKLFQPFLSAGVRIVSNCSTKNSIPLNSLHGAILLLEQWQLSSGDNRYQEVIKFAIERFEKTVAAHTNLKFESVSTLFSHQNKSILSSSSINETVRHCLALRQRFVDHQWLFEDVDQFRACESYVVRKSYGLSVQCLALPIWAFNFAKFSKESNKSVDLKPFAMEIASWRLSDICRISLANSLCILSAADRDLISVDWFMNVLLQLLQDESCEVRLAASQLSFEENMSGKSGDDDDVILDCGSWNHSVVTRRVLLEKFFQVSPSCHIVKLCMDIFGHLSSTLQNHANMGSTTIKLIFTSKDFNIYHEQTTALIELWNALMKSSKIVNNKQEFKQNFDELTTNCLLLKRKISNLLDYTIELSAEDQFFTPLNQELFVDLLKILVLARLGIQFLPAEKLQFLLQKWPMLSRFNRFAVLS